MVHKETVHQNARTGTLLHSLDFLGLGIHLRSILRQIRGRKKFTKSLTELWGRASERERKWSTAPAPRSS